MPLDKLVLIIVAVLSAAGLTIWVGALIAASLQFAPALGISIASLVALAAYVAWRVIADRINNREDDHYDHIKK